MSSNPRKKQPRGKRDVEPPPPKPERVLAEILEEAPDEEKSELIAQFLSVHSPVPFPDIVKGYEDAVKGGGKWLLQYTKDEQEHRHDIDRKRARYFASGQYCAFFLGLVGLAGGIYLAASGAHWFGFAAFFSSLISLVGLFIYNKKQDSKPEGREKSSPDEPRTNGS